MIDWNEVLKRAEHGNPAPPERIVKSEDEWRAQLTTEQFAVARQAGTERPFSHDNFPKRRGRFHCVCCGAALFGSDTKFDSGTGWPSFWAPIDDEAVAVKEDRSWFMVRTEVLCAKCDAHLGHVFDDGPQPTGKRFCMNGVAMTFEADE